MSIVFSGLNTFLIMDWLTVGLLKNQEYLPIRFNLETDGIDAMFVENKRSIRAARDERPFSLSSLSTTRLVAKIDLCTFIVASIHDWQHVLRTRDSRFLNCAMRAVRLARTLGSSNIIFCSSYR